MSIEVEFRIGKTKKSGVIENGSDILSTGIIIPRRSCERKTFGCAAPERKQAIAAVISHAFR
jgi:hypothetical protein